VPHKATDPVSSPPLPAASADDANRASGRSRRRRGSPMTPAPPPSFFLKSSYSAPPQSMPADTCFRRRPPQRRARPAPPSEFRGHLAKQLKLRRPLCACAWPAASSNPLLVQAQSSRLELCPNPLPPSQPQTPPIDPLLGRLFFLLIYFHYFCILSF
jgi:hypothetical protein